MKHTTSLAAVAAAGSLLATGPLALAAGSTAAPKGGGIDVFIQHIGNSGKADISITGAIGDYGTTRSVDADGKPARNGNLQKVTLSQGGLLIDTTQLDKVTAHVRPQVNEQNCSVLYQGTGPAKIVSGTGAYTGATGSLKITITFAAIVPRTGGRCNLDAPDATTHGEFSAITGTGKVSFSN